MSDKADVIVVGGGVIGLSCAWRLAQDGADVVLLEKSYCGSGASGASLGALMPASATKHGPTQMWQRACLWAYPEFAQELQEASGIDIGYERCGLLELLRNEQRQRQALLEAETAAREWPALDAEPVMSVLSNEEAVEIEPGVVCTEFGARQCRATGQVDVERLIEALRTAGTRAGVDVREGVAVTGLRRDGARVTGVACDGGTCAAAAVLVTAGAWTSGIDSALERAAGVRPARGQALLLRADRPVVQRMIKRRGNYLMPRPNNEVLVGSTTEPEAGFEVRTTGEGVAGLAEAAMELAPVLAEATFVRAWAGLRPEPLSRRPVMGRVEASPGLFAATGHYKTGIGMCSLAGRVMADVVGGRAPSSEVESFAPASR